MNYYSFKILVSCFLITFTFSSPIQNNEAKITQMENEIQSLKLNLSKVVMDFDDKYEYLKNDIDAKFEIKVKREQRGKFVTEETFDEIAKKIDQLQELPSDISDVVEKKYTDITNDITKTTITRDEFAHFQLMVIRDTCQLRYHEGQWVTFQKRGQFGNDQDYFARDMNDYVHGFGNPSMEFWLGLDKLVALTRSGDAELMIELETFEGKKVRAMYSQFQVSGSDFTLSVSGYSGDAGDTLKIDNGMKFSARDQDNDLWVGDCSKTRGSGGWWYNGCGLANLNGINFGRDNKSYDGIIWYFYAGDNRNFKTSKMMLRRRR